MKKIFLLLCIGSFSAASAQQNDLFDIQKHILKKQAVDKNKTIYFFKQNPIESMRRLPGISKPRYKLATGNFIITLPIDNMPCVVADMQEFRAMPNVGIYTNLESYTAGKIPNPAPPFGMKDLVIRSK